MTGLSLRRGAALMAIPVILIACAVFATASIERQSALHAGSQQEAAQDLLTGMLDQETGARGFFQTADRTFLTPWYQGSDEFVDALARARRLTSGDAPLQQSLTEQDQLFTQWRRVLSAEITQLERTGRRPTLTEDVLHKSSMDEFRQVNTLFDSQLANRRDAALSLATWRAVGLAAGLSLLLVAAGIVLIRRSGRRQSAYLARQQELRELLQVAETEQESQLLLVHHIQRSVPGSQAAVLNRNSSDDRLECRLDPETESRSLAHLDADHLKPRSCLAVRLSRPYRQTPGAEPLLRCEACGKLAADVVCEPLLVGGQVIGSVIVARERVITDAERDTLANSVLLAGPILANQRNLAVAERRAASDVLTGLPNRRAADETIKRMAAHAGRTITPLSAILLDLDHFKQVNDLHGHERGDQVLAVIGQVLASELRASDFAARYGGEEFLVLLPDTDRAGAVEVAEKLRRAVERTELDKISTLTASFGIASLPADAADPEQLLRKADRALYSAKARGRNRVEVVAPTGGARRSESEDPGAPPPFA
ncbi:MAG TPA: diguanylate cyclase [Solirubrobacteraceae bacterium]